MRITNRQYENFPRLITKQKVKKKYVQMPVKCFFKRKERLHDKQLVR